MFSAAAGMRRSACSVRRLLASTTAAATSARRSAATAPRGVGSLDFTRPSSQSAQSFTRAIHASAAFSTSRRVHQIGNDDARHEAATAAASASSSSSSSAVANSIADKSADSLVASTSSSSASLGAEASANVASDAVTAAAAVAQPEDAYRITIAIADALQSLQATVHLPWYLFLAMMGVTLRTLMLPINVKMLRHQTKAAELQPQIEELKKAVEHETDPVRQQYYRQQLMEKMQGLFNFWPFAQMPVLISMFVGIRHLAAARPEIFENGGVLWFSDLAATDSTYILPVSLGATTFLLFKIGADGIEPAKAKIMQYFIGVLGIGMVYISSAFPMALHVYWASNNLFSIAWTLLSRQTAVREALDLPPLKLYKSEPATSSAASGPAKIRSIDERNNVVIVDGEQMPSKSSSAASDDVPASANDINTPSPATTSATAVDAAAAAAAASTTSSNASSSSSRKRKRRKPKRK